MIILADVSKTTVFILLVLTILVSVLGVLTVLQATTVPKLENMITPVAEAAGTDSTPEENVKAYESDATVNFVIGRGE